MARRRSIIPPISAPNDSIFPWPYVWSSSAGFRERVVATSRMSVETASNDAWAESLRRARLPVDIAARVSTTITEIIPSRETLRAPVFVTLSIDLNANPSLAGP
jgi:hypothetical protein